MVCILTLAASAVIAGRKQTRQLERVNSATTQLKLSLLSSTLEQTHTDLSIRKRPPDRNACIAKSIEAMSMLYPIRPLR